MSDREWSLRFTQERETSKPQRKAIILAREESESEISDDNLSVFHRSGGVLLETEHHHDDDSAMTQESLVQPDRRFLLRDPLYMKNINQSSCEEISSGGGQTKKKRNSLKTK